MKEKNVIMGLMMLLFHSASGNLLVTLMACTVLSTIFLITGNPSFYMFFVILTVVMPLYTIITSIAGGYLSKYTSKWERFQIAMPIKRKDVISSRYLCMLIVSIVGIPVFVIIMSIGIALHQNLSEIIGKIISSTVSIFSISFGVSILLGALFFPLTCMKIGENKRESLAFACMLGALGIIGLVSWLGLSMHISQYTISLFRIAVSVIAFILSYLFTKNLYEKLDL